ncbi:permease for cytosine/purines, uracil, thiamine, allantoin-domain-containing protein [Leptodontidium sp. MPI-SDFR-AT-0119]|nr:permease for cytosine/purines, uracil, thiamine, allantoin-domain-containing protein [Leptodontidium sp. MPI-SDFR-AT-0119]
MPRAFVPAYFPAIGAWAMTPWHILSSAESPINFMSGYTWLAPLSGILIADYWIVHRQVLSVLDMYRPDGTYAYSKYGTNWRAVVAFLVGFVPLLPDFARSVNPKVDIGDGPMDFYYLGHFYGFGVAAGLHILLSKLFPAKETMLHRSTSTSDVDV